MGEGVDDGGDRRALRAFAGAERTFGWTVDQLDLDLRHVRHGEDRIARPIASLDPVLVEANFLLEGPAHGLDDPAFHLVGEAVGIDDQPGIDRGPHPWHTDLAAGAVDLDIGNAGDVAGEVLVLGEADAAAARAVALLAIPPAGVPGNRLDHRPGARVLQMRE